MLTRDNLARRWFSLPAFAVISASAAVVASTALIVGATRAPIRRDEHTIDVVGTAKRHVAADRITWEMDITARAATREAARSQLATRVARVRTYFTDHAIDPGELDITAASVEADTDTSSDVFGGLANPTPQTFVASQHLVIRSSAIARVLKTHREAAVDLTNLEGDDLSCSASAAGRLESELLTAARRDARAKAQSALAELGGASLGRLVTTDVGSFDADSTSLATCVDGYDATATVHATYQLE